MADQLNEKIDLYIDSMAEFARPILWHLREVVHKACPDIEEKIKWSMPHFDYKGPLCHMAGFKKHCAFGFWQEDNMADPDKLFSKEKGEGAMGALGRIYSLKDLPNEDVLIKYIKAAVSLNENGVKIKRAAPATDKTLIIPEDLKRALGENGEAEATFEKFSYSQKKEYVDWLLDAKTEATRLKRLTKAIELMAEGKKRHWKYQR